ncbi:MAG: phosphoadenosine phosphosulfate reductase family protein [Candidatus Methanomethylophilaceae archaeon]|nr:phosphoadenosine phosphosulfate reductase family protein [Candidatus Methanomethylophilaceae archaeon]
MAIVLGKNCLNWCYSCNMPVVSAKTCPKCGSPAEAVPVSSPWDLRPAFKKDVELIRGLADEEYGKGCGRDLIPDDRVVILNDNSRGTDSVEIVIDGYVIGSMRFKYDMKWHLTLDVAGFRKVIPHLQRHKVIANHSGLFMMKRTKNLLVKGVKECDPDSQVGDKMAVLSDKGELISCGTLCIPPSEIPTSERGMVVRMKETNKGYRNNDRPVNWEQTIRWNRPMMEKMVSDAIAEIKKIRKEYSDLPIGVSFSGGKDSQAVLMLFMDAKMKVNVIFADTGLEYPETVDFVNSYVKSSGMKLYVTEASFESFLKNMKVFGPPAEGYRWCCKTNKLSAIAAAESEIFPNGSVQFVGQRRYESKNRMRNGKVFRNQWIPNQVAVAPIQDWNALHVWLYILMRKQPFNPKYEQHMPRIGCMLCPFMSLAEIEMNKGTNEKFDRWYNAIEEYGRSRGMPEEWMKYHLWRFRELPQAVYDEVGPLCGKSYEELTKRTLPPVRPPLKLKMQEGFSPCVLGYSVEAGLSRPVNVNRLYGFSKILGKKTELEEDSYLAIGDLTVYAEGAIISKGGDLKEVKKSIRTVFEILIKSEECCGCKQCSTRCPTGALTLVDEKVEMDPSKCISCQKCLCTCPSLKYSTD